MCACQHDKSDLLLDTAFFFVFFLIGGSREVNKGKALPQLPVFFVLCCCWQANTDLTVIRVSAVDKEEILYN